MAEIDKNWCSLNPEMEIVLIAEDLHSDPG